MKEFWPYNLKTNQKIFVKQKTGGENRDEGN